MTEPPQYYIKTFSAGGASSDRKISHFSHPYPSLKDLQKEIIRYTRDDGVELNATLYLPPGQRRQARALLELAMCSGFKPATCPAFGAGYDRERDGPLPCILWAYPREFKSKDAAGQIRKSPHNFSGIGSSSPLLWLARKYAVLDGPGFPIIAEGDEEPNDTFLEQLTASARAAVAELERRGVVDLKRIAVGGHSYGSFMAGERDTLPHQRDGREMAARAPDTDGGRVACVQPTCWRMRPTSSPAASPGAGPTTGR